jgi:SagB-type dehydrogenase family enzyme
MSSTETLQGPALRSGLAIVPVHGGVIVEGGARRQRFSGTSAADLLPRLLPLLDGTRDRPALCREFDLSEQALDHVLGLLDDRGLLEPEGAGQETGEVAAFFSRTAAIGWSQYPSGSAARRALRDWQVLISAPAPVLDLLSADLRSVGVGTVTPWTGSCVASQNSLVIVYETEPDDLAAVVEACGPAGVPVLRCNIGTEAVEIGPWFDSGYTCCPDCFHRGHRHAFPQWTPRPPMLDTDTATSVLTSIVTVEVLLRTVWIGGYGPRNLRCIDLGTRSESRYLVAPEGDCPRCALPQRVNSADTFATYEWHVQQIPSDLVPNKQSVPPPVADPTPVRISYASCPRVPLSSVPDSDDAAVFSRLMHRTVGRMPDSGRRWTPTGGDLGSVELFLLTDMGWPGLPGNVFKYDPDDDTLLAVRADHQAIADLLPGTGLPVDDIRGLMVFTGAVWRLAPKYGPFALRLTHLDSGCATTQLSLLAAETDLAVRFATGRYLQFTEALELDRRTEIVTAVAGIYPRESVGYADHQ